MGVSLLELVPLAWSLKGNQKESHSFGRSPHRRHTHIRLNGLKHQTQREEEDGEKYVPFGAQPKAPDREKDSHQRGVSGAGGRVPFGFFSSWFHFGLGDKRRFSIGATKDLSKLLPSCSLAGYLMGMEPLERQDLSILN